MVRFRLPMAVVVSLTAAAASGQSPGASSAGPISIPQIEQEEFEPAVGKQIRHAYEEARRKPDDAEAAGRLGMILQCYGKYESAGMCYRRARALAPRSFRWAYYLGNVEAWLGKNQEGVEQIRNALQLDTTYTPARVRLGQMLLEAGDLEESARAFEESIRQNPRLAAAHLGLGRVRQAGGDWSRAIESYRRTSDIAPNDAAARYALAMAYKKTGDADKARDQLNAYQRVKESVQPSEDPLMNEVKSLYMGGLSHFAKASSLVQQGKNNEAIAEFESALRVNPRMVMAHIDLIALYGGLGEKDKAERHFRQAVELDPGWAEAYYNWGLLLARAQSSEAVDAFRKAIAVNPHYADAHIRLGLLLDETGHWAKAQESFQRALDDQPSNRESRFLLGRSLIRTGDFHAAIAQLVQTTQVDDDKTPVCLQTLAVAYQRAGDLKAAVNYLQQARQRALARKMDQLAAELQRQLDELFRETKGQ